MASHNKGAGTALITGAGHGIGAAFAQQLVATHDRLILVDKDRQALDAFAGSLAHAGPGAIELLAANLASPADQDRVIKRIEQEGQLSLLINNAGFGAPALFYEQDPQVQLDMLQVHVMSAVRFSRAALPGMVAAGHGNIVIVSSMAAELPVCGNVMYGSTKGFLRTFAEILRTECDAANVNLQLLCPGYTRTHFHSTPNYQSQDFSRVPHWAWSSAEAVAQASILRPGQTLVHLCAGVSQPLRPFPAAAPALYRTG